MRCGVGLEPGPSRTKIQLKEGEGREGEGRAEREEEGVFLGSNLTAKLN